MAAIYCTRDDGGSLGYALEDGFGYGYGFDDGRGYGDGFGYGRTTPSGVEGYGDFEMGDGEGGLDIE